MKTNIRHIDYEFAYTPQPPEYKFDWDGILNNIPLVSDLQGVEQNPKYHAEGDVAVHTKAVLDELVASEKWRKLSTEDRMLTFMACLFHDIGKKVTSKIGPSGTIHSPKHALIGEKMFRRAVILNEIVGEPMPFTIREHVAQLIRSHGLPLWIMEKGDPERVLTMTSFLCRLDLLAIIAEADMRGRICADKGHHLERIELFVEYAIEQECLATPRPFFSDHSRVSYFRNYDLSAGYQAYDDTKGVVILLMGLPAAGKDYYINKHYPDMPVISLDALRAELNLPHGKNQGKVLQESKERAKALMREGKSFIWNATNLSKDRRTPLIKLFSSYKMRTRVVYLEHPFNVTLKRNQNREAIVPEKFIRKSLKIIDMPNISEVHEIEFVISE